MNYRSGYDELPGDAVLDAMGELVFVLSEDGTVLAWNDAVADVTGRTDTEFESTTFHDLLAEPDREDVTSALDRDGPATCVATLTTSTGGLPYEFSFAALNAGAGDESARVLVTGREATREMETQEELRDRTNLVEQIFEQVPINLYVKDADCRHLWMSNMHRDPEGVIGETDREFYDGDFGEGTYADDMRVIETGEPLLDVEEYNPNRETWTLTSKTPWYGEDGEVRGLIGVTRDISERKEYKRELERQNERLERFANVVSHDLRNPLNVATGYLDAIAEECDSEHIDRVDSALERMEHMVTDILTMAREGQTVEEREPVSLSALARDSWRNVDTGPAELVVGRDVEFEADPVRVRSALENLFRNAVEHGPSDVTVRVGSLDDGWYVDDDGPGIPADVRDAVFELGHTSRERGTGFGLNIVEQIVEAHRWDVEITDGTDGGARFEITGVESVGPD